jgi:DMSO reductase anchor subunit
VTRWLLVLAAWVALELVVLYCGAWLAHKVVPPWAFSPTLLLNFVLLVAVGGAIFCHAISKSKRP